MLVICLTELLTPQVSERFRKNVYLSQNEILKELIGADRDFNPRCGLILNPNGIGFQASDEIYAQDGTATRLSLGLHAHGQQGNLQCCAMVMNGTRSNQYRLRCHGMGEIQPKKPETGSAVLTSTTLGFL